MNVYMRVTQDKYSLPLDIDTSPTELAKRWGEPRQTLFMQIWRQKKGVMKRYPRFVCVEVEDGDNVDEGHQ